MKDWQNSPFIESLLFLLIILMEAAIFIFLMQKRWIVGGQDGFQYFALQYSFLNNVINCGEIPQWMPFMTHGALATWWHSIQGGIFQNVLFLSGSLFKDINFLPLFYAGIFLDELLLLVGIWLLGRRFFASPFTVFFVSLSVMGSCIWMLQPWWNFHIYYAIPLILYLLHTFLDGGKWRYYFLAGNLLFMQCLGNLPYFLPVTSLVIFLYFLFYFAFDYQNILQKIKTLQFGWPFVLTTSLIILLFIALKVTMTVGTDQIVNYNVLRNLDGTSTLDAFLTYGGGISWRAWWELILGISPFLDYNLYIGIVCVPLILLGLIFNSNKQNLHFLLTIIVVLLFSMGTFVSILFYYLWPMMKFFRHLALVSPIIKVFLCFMAGFGFDALFFNKVRWNNPIALKVSLAVVSAFMFFSFFILLYLAHNYNSSVNMLLGIVPAEHTFFRALLEESILISLLKKTAFFVIISSILFAVLSFINREKYFLPVVILLLAFHCADIYGFKFSEISLKTAPLNDDLYKITDFQTMPFAKRRDISFESNNPRSKLLEVLPIQYAAFFNWAAHGFLFKDELGNSFRTDHWLLPLDNYMRAYWGQPVHDLSVKPSGLFYYSRLEFPQGHPAALKISGVTEDKIQFFSQANVISSDDAIASLITNPKYKGDIIFLSPLKGHKETISNSMAIPKINLSSDSRLRLPYQVQRFDANNLEVTADTDGLGHTWLLYSDIWHPLWRATVNGKETPVYKANLAYKAIKLENGPNKIHFLFKSRLIAFLYFIFGLNALAWLSIIIYMTGKMIFNLPKYTINYTKAN